MLAIKINRQDAADRIITAIEQQQPVSSVWDRGDSGGWTQQEYEALIFDLVSSGALELNDDDDLQIAE